MTYAEVLHKWRESTIAQFSWGNLTPEMLYASFDAFCEELGVESLTFEQFQMQAEKECALLRISLRPVMLELYIGSGQVPIEFQETAELVRRMHPDIQWRVSPM